MSMKKFFPLVKVDEAQRIVYGLVTAEQPDRDGEICHYATTVPYFKAWSDVVSKASDGKSIGNLREMHGLSAAGAGKSIEFDDTNKSILMGFKVVDDQAWMKVQEGVYTGFSQGGEYVKRWQAEWTDGEKYTFYTSSPIEVSLVDMPCLPAATFEYVKANGQTEVRKFAKLPTPAETVLKAIEQMVSNATAKTAGGEAKPIAVLTEGDITRISQAVKALVPDNAQLAQQLAELLKVKKDGRSEACKGETCAKCSGADCTHACHTVTTQTQAKTRKIGDEELPASSFAHVGEAEDPKTWRFPIESADADKTKIFIRTSLILAARDQSLTDDERVAAGKTLAEAAAASEIDLNKEAQQLMAAYSYHTSDGVEKSLWDVQDMAGVLMTLSYIQRSLDYEREWEGDESPIPDNLVDVMESLASLLADLVDEETQELLAAARHTENKKTTMKTELNKAQKTVAEHIGKAAEMIADHHEKTVGMHKVHADVVTAHIDKALTALGAAKASSPLAVTLSKAKEAVQSNCDKACKAVGSHSDEMGGQLGKITKALGSDIAIATLDNNDPDGTDPISIDPAKGLTQADLSKALEKNTLDVLELVVQALTGSEAGPAPGLGDRTQIVTAPKVQQTAGTPVTKAADAVDNPAAVPAGPTPEMVKKFAAGDAGALLALARTIKPEATGVPATIQGMFTR